jgi:NAD(P)-dependent dehydrogenase (short-subunit alcohol dehydrogenase family)
METGLNDKTVIVTGGNANIGRGIALAFAQEGANVVIAARDADAGARVVAKALEDGAADAVFVKTDVLETEQVKSLVAATLERFGAIDVLVNNVGGNIGVAPFWETTPENWRRELDLNVTSMLQCTHAVLPSMIERKYGRIVNIGSTAALIGDLWMSVYSAGKGAMHAFTRILAKEVGPHGITVNAVVPRGTFPADEADYDEWMSTGSRWHPSLGVRKSLRERAVEAEHSLGRDPTRDKTVVGRALGRQFLYPHEVGAAAVFLAADTSSFITGHLLVTDGGLTLA